MKADPLLLRGVHAIGWTPLHFAAFAGNLKTAKLLLDRGADIEARAKNKFDNTPLQVAALTAQAEVIALLLERGADARATQAEGFTPLHEAAILGDVRMMKLLLDAGADVNAAAHEGRTPLGEALRHDKQAAAAFLRARGARDTREKERNAP